MKIEQVNNALLVWGLLEEKTTAYIRQQERMVVIPEMRPFFIGVRHNLPLLKMRNPAMTYCTDNMLGLLFFRQAVAELLLVYTKEEARGIVAPSGSLYAGMLARLHGVKISLHQGPVLNYNTLFKDTDASSLCGKKFFPNAAAVAPAEEYIDYEELKEYEKIR